MDATRLQACFASSMQSDANVRQRAELDLLQVQATPGFMTVLFDVMEAPEPVPGVRQAAATCFKNCVTKRWGYQTGSESPSPDNPKIISDDDKTTTRNRVIPLLRMSDSTVRKLLTPALQKILHNDFPEKWPGFLEECGSLLHAQDLTSVDVGLQCLFAICRTYRFKNGPKDNFDKIVEQLFPRILTIGNSLVSETSKEAGDMLATVVKTYKQTIFFELPQPLRAQETMSGWCTLFLNIIAKTPPECSMVDDIDARAQHPWFKCKKRSYVNLNRLFFRYGNPTSLGRTDDTYKAVAEDFIERFAPVILQGYLVQIEKWVGKTVWMSRPCLSHTLSFLNECIKPKVMWERLQPHMDILIEHLLFPVLCQSDEDLEQFDNEPIEYIQQKMNFFEEFAAPDSAATAFLTSLTKNRRKQTFQVLTFVNSIVDKYAAAPEDQKNPREKEGALRMIGTLASVILGKKSPIADKVELFFVQYVFPEFDSKHAFLRARACDTLEEFELLDFKDPNNLLLIYQKILGCMADPALPVRVEAALTLQPLIRHEVVKTSMQHNIPQIMQQLLKLTNEVDIDSLANVMEEFVEVFAPQLTPFAIALSEQLRDTYLRIIRDILDRQQNVEDDDDVTSFLDDKSVTALGVLQTIGTLILTLESSPDVLAHLETVLLPIVVITLEHKLDDLYNEVFEIVDSCTFSAKTISPTMWTCFELMHKTYKSGGELYMEDMLPALENFVSFGSAQLMQREAYFVAMLDIVVTNLSAGLSESVDRICGCRLAEVLLLNMRGFIDKQIPQIIALVMRILTSETQATSIFKLHLMEVVINAIYCNAQVSLAVLESQQWTNKFFSLWFSSIDMFVRVHDKKLSICAISALLSLPASSIPPSILPGWPRLLQGAIKLFQTLPAAMKNREQAIKENEEDHAAGADDDEDADWEEKIEWNEVNEGDDGGDVKDEGDAYLEFLGQQAAKIGGNDGDGDDDDELDLEEEALLETPLDKIEPYSLIKNVLFNCQQQEPGLYTDITKTLSPEEQRILQSVIAQADHAALHQQQHSPIGQAQHAHMNANGEHGHTL